MSTAHIPWGSKTPYRNPFCKISNLTRKLVTKGHYSYCDGFPLQVGLGTELPFMILDDGKVHCSVLAQILYDAPARFRLIGMTMVRNPVYLREWIQYHLGHFGHLVVYDDGSDVTDVTSLVSDFLAAGRATLVDWSHAAPHGSRQPAAIQDFALRFARAAEWAAYLDDDSFFPPAGPRGRPLLDLLDAHARAGVAQVIVPGAWFGACATRAAADALNLSVAQCFSAAGGRAGGGSGRAGGGRGRPRDMLCPVLDARGCPLHELFAGRLDPVAAAARVPAIHPTRRFTTTFALVRTRGAPFAAGNIPHKWALLPHPRQGRTVTTDPRTYHYRHLKLLDYARHQRKAANGSWTMMRGRAGLGAWLEMNRGLCRALDAAAAPDAGALAGKC